MFYSRIWAHNKPKSSPSSTFPLRCASSVLQATVLKTSTLPPLTTSARSQECFLATGFPGTRCPLLLASSSWTPAPRHASCSSHTALGRIRHLLVHAIISILSCLKPMNFVGSCAPWPHSTVTSRLQPFKTAAELIKKPQTSGCRPSWTIILAIVRIFVLLLQALLVGYSSSF